MREIKFRGKRKDNGEWVTGFFWLMNDEMNANKACITISILGADDFSNYEVLPITVGQFTGLKDKNGKEIYEGDILMSFSASVPSYEVFYFKSSYRLRYKMKNGEYYDWGPLFRMEEIQWERRLPLCPDVIGNIHDNPELLNPAGGQSSVNNMLHDPNLKADSEVKEEAANAQESAEQDKAVGADESDVKASEE